MVALMKAEPFLAMAVSSWLPGCPYAQSLPYFPSSNPRWSSRYALIPALLARPITQLTCRKRVSQDTTPNTGKRKEQRAVAVAAAAAEGVGWLVGWLVGESGNLRPVAVVTVQAD